MLIDRAQVVAALLQKAGEQQPKFTITQPGKPNKQRIWRRLYKAHMAHVLVARDERTER